MAISTPERDTKLEQGTETLGPAMQAISIMQRNFVRALLDTGGNNYTEAAEMAGYSTKSRNSLRVAGSNLARDPKVLAAIQEESKKRLHSGLILAVNTVLEIIGNPGQKASDRLKAVEILMSRCGMPAVSQHVVNVKDDRTDAERLDEIMREMKEAGLKFANLGGALIQDAEWRDVSKTNVPKQITHEEALAGAKMEWHSGTAGLEDLL